MIKNSVCFILYLFIFQIATVYAEEIQAPELLASHAVLMDADTGIVLYGKDAHEETYPASITKIMTALITLEQCQDLNETITFSHYAVFSLPRNASHIAMDEGETLTLYDALHGLLLSSANEVANALAEHVAGSVQDFALLMNKRAQGLGAVNTHFENPTGLHADNHYTTAYDMALIMNEAVKHEVFKEIIAKRRHDIPPTEKQALQRELLNTNRIIHAGLHYNEDVIGGKTGFTDEAQHTLVTYAKQDGRSLIASVLRSGRPGMYDDTNALFAYGFELPYEEQVIFDGEAYERSIPVYYESEVIGDVTVKGAEDLVYMLPGGFDRADIRYEAKWPEKLSPPVLIGDELGTITCFIQDKKIGEVALTATNAMFMPISEETALAVSIGTAPLGLSDGKLDETSEEEVAWEPEIVAGHDTLPIWETDYLLTLAVPLMASAVALVLSFIVFISKRKRRQAQILRFDRYAKYTTLYKLK